MEFFFYVTAADGGYDFDLTQLGYAANETVPVYDIWAKQSEGTATGSINVNIPSHGVKLYRLGDKIATGISEQPTSHATAIQPVNTQCYDLQGRTISTPSTGLYIQGNKVKLKK
jgi:hypothetical protein